MSNRFYTFINQLITGSVAKSSEVNAQFSGTSTGFDAVELEMNRAIKFPAAEGSTNQAITQVPSARQGYLIGFDASGNLLVTNKFVADWNMNGFRLRGCITAVHTDEPVTLGQLSAYSASLIAGLPSIVAQNGPLTTDGVTVIWDSANRLVPTATSANVSDFQTYNGSATIWNRYRHNVVIDPNGTQGSAYWSSTLTVQLDHLGYRWGNWTGALAGATFDHKPQAAGWIPMPANSVIGLAVNVATLGTTGGSIQLVMRYYDVALALISESTGTAISMNTARTRYTSQEQSPSGTVWCAPVLKFTNVSAPGSVVQVSDMKVEQSWNFSTFNDDATFSLAGAAKQANPLGYGFASPSVTLGDATATTSTYNFRSTTGTQAYDARIRSTGGTNGTVGKGALAVESKQLTNTGPIGYAAEYDAGVSGAAKTINFGTNGSRQKLTLDTVTPAITFAPAPVVGHYQLKVVQDAAVARVPTYVGINAANCVGGSLPSISSTLSSITFIYLYWDGSVYWVSSSQWS